MVVESGDVFVVNLATRSILAERYSTIICNFELLSQNKYPIVDMDSWTLFLSF